MSHRGVRNSMEFYQAPRRADEDLSEAMGGMRIDEVRHWPLMGQYWLLIGQNLPLLVTTVKKASVFHSHTRLFSVKLVARKRGDVIILENDIEPKSK